MLRREFLYLGEEKKEKDKRGGGEFFKFCVNQGFCFQRKLEGKEESKLVLTIE